MLFHTCIASGEETRSRLIFSRPSIFSLHAQCVLVLCMRLLSRRMLLGFSLRLA